MWCGAIGKHNRCRQDDLQLEKKLGTIDWSMCVNVSIFGMCVVDSWLAYRGCKGIRCAIKQAFFYMLLAEKLIDSMMESGNLRARQRTLDESGAVAASDRMPQGGVGAHLIPTKRHHKDKQARWLEVGDKGDAGSAKLVRKLLNAQSATRRILMMGSAGSAQHSSVQLASRST